MKKVILFAAILFAGVSVVKVQAQATPTGKTSTTTFNLNLYPIQSIIVNPSESVVDMDYRTVEDYVNGAADVVKSAHLTVFSVGGFSVKVNSADDNFESESVSKISTSMISLKATTATDNLLEISNGDVPLTKAQAELFSSATGTINSNFDVTYSSVEETNAFANPLFYKTGEKVKTVHTTTVTYSIYPG